MEPNKRFYCNCVNRIHQALAKAVMRRDLAVRQNKRAQREQEEAAEKQRAAVKPTEIKAESLKVVSEGQAAQDSRKDEDAMMPDYATLASEDQVKDESNQDASKAEESPKPAETAATIATSVTSETPKDEAPKPPRIQTSISEPAPATTTVEEPPQPSPTNSLFGKTPTTAGGQFHDPDFDSMFDDYGKDNSPGQANLDSDTSDNLDFSQMEGQSHALLPGLENYAYIGEGGDSMDFMMSLDDGVSTGGNENNTTTETRNAEPDAAAAGQQPNLVDTSFDDLFDFPTDFNPSGTGSVGDDDDLMKLLNG